MRTLLLLASALPAIASNLSPRDIPALTDLITTITDSLNNFTATYATSNTNTASLPPAFSSLLTTFSTTTSAVTTLSSSSISALQVPSLADPALDLVAAGGLLVAALTADKAAIAQQQGGCKTVHDGLEGLMGAAGRWNAAVLGVLPAPEGGEVFGEGEGTLAGVVRGGVGEFGAGECATKTGVETVKPKETTGAVGGKKDEKKNAAPGRGGVGWGVVVGMGVVGVVVGF